MIRTAVIIVCLATIGYGEVCKEENVTVTCGESFEFPLANVSSDIEKLVVHSHSLKAINEEDLTEYPELRIVDLSNSGIVTIHQNAFAENPNLEEVNLSNNVDLKIASDAPIFESESVKTLNLESTGITDLTDVVFSKLPNLSTLNLASNEINDIESALENAPQIKTLIIMKDNGLDRDILCTRTSLSQVISKYFDDLDNLVSDIYSCNDQAKIKAEKQEEDTEEPQPEADAIAPVEESQTVQEVTTKIPEDEEIHDEKTEEPATEKVPTEKVPDEPSVDALVPHEQDTEEPKTEKAQIVDEPLVKDNEIGEGVVQVDPNAPIVNRKDTRMLMPPNDVANEIDQKVSESKKTDESVSGSSLVLGIIVVVLVVGAIGIGYKYWKSHRGYHNTRTDDVEEGKEMKTISSNNKTLIEQNE